MSNNLSDTTSLTILLWNCNGVLQHVNELQYVLQQRRVDVALLCETHLLQRHVLNILGYKTYRSDHPDGAAHGGTAILVKTSLSHHLLPSTSTNYLQNTLVSVKCTQFQISLAAVYCPPRFRITTQNFETFFSSLGSRFIAGGDFNSKHQQWGSRIANPRGRQLLRCMNANRFSYIAPNEYTYWPNSLNKRPDLLDFFVTKNINLFTHVETLHELASDHTSLLLSLSAHPIHILPRPSLLGRAMDWDNFRQNFNDDINLLLPLKCQEDIEIAVEHFVHTVQKAAWHSSSWTPRRTNNLPIYPEYIRELIRKKRHARKKWQNTRRPTDKIEYNRLNNTLKSTIRDFKRSSYDSYLASLNSADNSLWKATKRILNYNSVSFPLRNNNGSWAADDQEKAEVFGEHLSLVFQPHDNISDPTHCEYVENKLLEPLQMTLPPKQFTPAEIKFQIQKLPLKKAPGYDLINAEILREIPRKGIVFLTTIFNAILRTSKFPIQWKFSVIKMIHKVGKPPETPASYRPISLLPVCAKLMEKLLYKRLIPIVVSNNIIPDHQFGFRHQHSTIHQLHRVVDYIAIALEQKKYAAGLFLDVSQAFDRVWHDGLLEKLRFLPPDYYLILQSFLTDRYFSVSQGNALSSFYPVKAGVPQGSILSPLLYNIYTSDIPSSNNVLLASYADDIAILASTPDFTETSIILQNHVYHLEKWLTKWRIKINTTKTVHSTFTLRRSTCPSIFLNNTAIPQANSIRYLGLLIDRRLTWNDHVKIKRITLDNRFKQLYRLLSRTSKLPTRQKLTIYKYLLRPIWTYAGQIYGCAKPSVVARIQRFQSKTLRTILNSPAYVSNQTIHHDTRISYVQDIFTKHYRVFHSKLSTHTNTLVQKLSTRHFPRNVQRRLKRRWSRDFLV
jgi:hypothetical protein